MSGAWTGLWIPDLSQMSLIECYWMPQNIRVTAFTFFELLRENQLGREGELYPPPPLVPGLLQTQLLYFVFITNNHVSFPF